MDLSTRIQVDHPVNRVVTGIDLIKEQIKIANNESIAFSQEDIEFEGWSIECRINAEDSFNNFMPSPGTVKMYLTPGGPGVRIDSAVYQGYSIPPYYDSMVAKLITYGSSREEAIQTMKRALDEFIVEGVKTRITFHREIMDHQIIKSGKFNTNFLEENPIIEKAEERE